MASLKPVSWVLTVALAVAASGVRHAAANEKSRSDFIPPDDQALLVFIQNLREDREMTFLVFEANRQCVAEVGGGQAKVVPMDPGVYTLYGAGYGTERFELHLEAGRTYFVRLHTVQRAFNRKSKVTPVRRGTESYMLLRTWLDGAHVTHASDDSCRGKPLRERKKRTARRVVEGDADWSEGGEIYRAERTLREQDGFTASELEMIRLESP